MLSRLKKALRSDAAPSALPQSVLDSGEHEADAWKKFWAEDPYEVVEEADGEREHFAQGLSYLRTEDTE